MGDLLQKAAAWLESQRTKHMTQAVTYARGADSVGVAATVGTTVFQVDDGAGALVKVESRDYLLLAEDLVIAGSLILPKRGDRILEASGESTFVYEVTSPGDEPCWRYSDPYRQTLRIHTKQVDQ